MNKKRIIFFLTVLVLVWGVSHFRPVQRILYPFPHRATVEKYAREYGVDPLLVVSVIREESKFLPRSESRKGAKGLMQLMPDTARWISQKLGDKKFTEQDLLQPEKNIQYGTWYLANLGQEFSGNTVLVVAAYNGGRGHVQEWIKTDQIDPGNVKSQDIPFQETRQYVDRVLKSYQKYIMLYRNT
ncbi:MAG: lytic transglycosylase domain-containing protein [Desulfitobacteriaceae bacterium]